MRIVVDTNVLVSGLINPYGSPGRVIDELLVGTLVPLHDDRMLAEYRDVLRRARFGFDRDRVDALLDFLAFVGEPVSGSCLQIALPDAGDLPFLEVAVAGGADAIVTGNGRHFIPTTGVHCRPILTPRELLLTLAAR